jgi:hypothetical protein
MSKHQRRRGNAQRAGTNRRSSPPPTTNIAPAIDNLTTTVPNSDDEADRGVTSRKNEGFSDDDLSDPEQDGDYDQDIHTLGNRNTARLGDERVKKKNNTKNATRLAKATRNKARAEKDKAGEATAPRQAMNPYRLQLKFGKVVQNEKRIVNIMLLLLVASFLWPGLGYKQFMLVWSLVNLYV